jgi:two-component system CheB/CheR fusion protein
MRLVPYQLRGVTRGVVVSFIDISELEATRAQLAAVMDALPEQMALLDGRGHVVQVNSAWRAFAVENGGPEDLGLGDDYLAVAARGGRVSAESDRVAQGLRAVLRGEIQRFVEPYRCDAGSEERHFELRAFGSRHGVVISHLDVTARAKEIARLEERTIAFRKIGRAHV